jgi:hypothetical protein
LIFSVEPKPLNPIPHVVSISPDVVEGGGPPFTITVKGTGFIASSTVVFSLFAPLATTLVDETTLQATVPAEYIGSLRTTQVHVTNPTPGGGDSDDFPFTVKLPLQPGVIRTGVLANDLVWDPYRQKLYLSVPGRAATYPNTVTVMDPYTGHVVGSQFAGSEPGQLALSDDGQFLYVGLGGASRVLRFAPPDLTPSLVIELGLDQVAGPRFAWDLQVAPAAPHTLAVSTFAGSPLIDHQVSILDDAVARSVSVTGGFAYLQWGVDADTLYASPMYTSPGFSVLSVDATGVALSRAYDAAYLNGLGRIHFDAVTGLIYGDNGWVLDAATGLLVGSFPLQSYQLSSPVIDASLGAAFRVNGRGFVELLAFDLNQYVQLRSMVIPYLSGVTNKMVRFGPDGLAFLVDGMVVLVRGPVVLPRSSEPNPVPTLTAFEPAVGVVGGANLRLAVTGTGFVPGSILQWNGADRTTTLLSGDRLIAYIPASDLAIGGSVQVAVTNPLPGGGVSGVSNFVVAP